MRKFIYTLIAPLFMLRCNNPNKITLSGTKWKLKALTAAENNRLDLYEAIAIGEFQNKEKTNKVFLNFLNDSTVFTETTSDTDHYKVYKDTLFFANQKSESDTFLIAFHSKDSLQLNSVDGMKASFKKLP